MGRVDGVWRKAVDLGLVEQQEERAEAADAVVRILAVEPCPGEALLDDLVEPGARPLAQLVQRAVLDRLGRAGLCARRRHAVAGAVVAEGALPHPAVALDLALVEHAERAGRHAVSAAVADILLDDDRAQLGADDRAGRAHVQAGRVGAVLAHVRAHQPAERIPVLAVPVADPQRPVLLDEGDVPPRVRAQAAGVVIGVGGEEQAVLGHLVPLLASDLAGLAADADARVGEEAHARPGLVAVGLRPGLGGDVRLRAHEIAPRGDRPGRMSQVAALTSWMCTLGSSTIGKRSLAESPFVRPREPQWYGRPTWCSVRPRTSSGRRRSVTSTRASIAARSVAMVAQPPCSSLRSAASSGLTSQN